MSHNTAGSHFYINNWKTNNNIPESCGFKLDKDLLSSRLQFDELFEQTQLCSNSGFRTIDFSGSENGETKNLNLNCISPEAAVDPWNELMAADEYYKQDNIKDQKAFIFGSVPYRKNNFNQSEDPGPAMTDYLRIDNVDRTTDTVVYLTREIISSTPQGSRSGTAIIAQWGLLDPDNPTATTKTKWLRSGTLNNLDYRPAPTAIACILQAGGGGGAGMSSASGNRGGGGGSGGVVVAILKFTGTNCFKILYDTSNGQSGNGGSANNNGKVGANLIVWEGNNSEPINVSTWTQAVIVYGGKGGGYGGSGGDGGSYNINNVGYYHVYPIVDSCFTGKAGGNQKTTGSSWLEKTIKFTNKSWLSANLNYVVSTTSGGFSDSSSGGGGGASLISNGGAGGKGSDDGGSGSDGGYGSGGGGSGYWVPTGTRHGGAGGVGYIEIMCGY